MEVHLPMSQTMLTHLNITFLQTETFSRATISTVSTEGRILSSGKGETLECQQLFVWESAAYMPTVLVLLTPGTPSEPWVVPTLLCTPCAGEGASPQPGAASAGLWALSLCLCWHHQNPLEATPALTLISPSWHTGTNRAGTLWPTHLHRTGHRGTICQEMAWEHNPGSVTGAGSPGEPKALTKERHWGQLATWHPENQGGQSGNFTLGRAVPALCQPWILPRFAQLRRKPASSQEKGQLLSAQHSTAQPGGASVLETHIWRNAAKLHWCVST